MTELKDLVVWGGLYKVKHNRWDGGTLRNDQIYRQAVPCLDNDGSLWMQDTHQLRLPSYKDGSATLGAMERIFNLKEKGEWAIRQSRSDWYHPGNEKITNEAMLDDYELICDLHDWRPCGRDDYRSYDSKDVLHRIHLYQEHGYSWDYGDIGVTLIRKDAEPVLYNKFKAALRDVRSNCTYPSYFGYSKLEDLLRYYSILIESNHFIDPKDQVAYENVQWLVNRLKDMNKEIETYMHEHRYKPEFDFEAYGQYLKDVHPDIERYLKEDCYCPGEIYDIKGLSYQLFTANHRCQLIIESDERLVVVSKSKDTSYPQLIMFWHDDENQPDKIVAAQRVDATKNNIEILSKIVNKENTSGYKINNYENETAEELNEIYNSL